MHDLQDWREPRNKSLDFVGGDLCKPLPIAENSFDIICSWNSFEHVPDPAAALAELLRICKPGGHIYLWFNPLWCSPLGLHALKFTMPYPQFLFSEELIETKMRELAGDAGGGDHWSHHKKHVDLMNKVRLATFREIWKNSGGEVVFLNETRNDQHLNVVANFPQAFTGRGLTLEDLVTDGIEVLLRKPER